MPKRRATAFTVAAWACVALALLAMAAHAALDFRIPPLALAAQLPPLGGGAWWPRRRTAAVGAAGAALACQLGAALFSGYFLGVAPLYGAAAVWFTAVITLVGADVREGTRGALLAAVVLSGFAEAIVGFGAFVFWYFSTHRVWTIG